MDQIFCYEYSLSVDKGRFEVKLGSDLSNKTDCLKFASEN